MKASAARRSSTTGGAGLRAPSRRGRLAVGGLVAAVLMVLTVTQTGQLLSAASPVERSRTESAPAPSPAPDCVVGAKLVPTCGALWGAYTKLGVPPLGGDWVRSYTALEAQVGRPFDVVKRYHDFSGRGGNGAFPDGAEQQLGADGRILFFAWVSENYSTGASASWPDISRGLHDASVVDPVAERLKAYGKPVFLDFDHEMDGRARVDNGSLAEYAEAFRHIRARFDAVGASNVVFVWTVTGNLNNTERIEAAYPGDAAVDWIAYDPYNFASCRSEPFEDFETVVAPFYDWLLDHGHRNKPLMLAEYGSAPDAMDPLGRARWFRGQVPTLRERPNIKAILYFNADGICPGQFSSSLSQDPAALQAFGQAGRDPYFQVKR